MIYKERQGAGIFCLFLWFAFFREKKKLYALKEM